MTDQTTERLERYAEAIGAVLGCAPTHPGALRNPRLSLVTWCREHFVASRDGNSILKGQWTDQGCPVAVGIARAVIAVADQEQAELEGS